ncbi:M48 family metallopeptidase [Candidatus Marinimicrobia bacterium]|nr:M48 family metallopeptidase [Candidatus Neomarinimicrobiota bacterium]
MSIFFIIIIGILLFEYVLNCMVSYLNLGALDPKLPEEFIKTFDEEKYIKTQEYTKVNTKYSFLTSTLSLVISLSFIFGGIYNEIDLYVRSIGFNDIIITGLCFFGILTIISDILTIPFSLYKTFVIEEKFGFNKMKLSTFFIDKIKGYLLMILMGGPLLYSILYFFENFTEFGWLYVWILLVSFSIIIQPIFNIFIAPLFNKFTPLEEGPLLDKIKAYLAKVNFPVKKLEVMDGSKRSSHSNAYFSGIGSNKRIALFDTLVEQMDDDEIVSIIAHEVGHYKLKHIYTGILLSAIQSGVMFYIMSLFLLNENLFSVFKMDNLSIYASLLFFSMLYAPISMILGVFFSAISRRNEFSADAYSVETAKMPNSMISSLKKLSKENLSNLTPHWLNVFLNYSHPPVLDRLNAIRKLEK